MARGEGWTRLPHKLVTQLARYPLSGAGFRLLLVIFRHTAGFGRDSWQASRDTLRNMMGVASDGTVDRAIAELAGWGIIIVKSRGRGRGHARTFIMRPPSGWFPPPSENGRNGGHFKKATKPANLDGGKMANPRAENGRYPSLKMADGAATRDITLEKKRKRKAAASASAPLNGSGYGGFSEPKPKPPKPPEPPSWRPGGECEQRLRRSMYDTEARETWSALLLQDPAAVRRLIATATRGLPEEDGNLAEARRRLLSLLAKEEVATP